MNETPQVLLTHYLKTLKLPTFLKEYGKVLNNVLLKELIMKTFCCVSRNKS